MRQGRVSQSGNGPQSCEGVMVVGEQQTMPHLTAREMDLVRGVVGGLSNAQIAEQLGLREQTVRNRLSVVFQKVGVTNRLQLAIFAIQRNVEGTAALASGAER
jgi:DNA-binding NarL/FixJ family response regulator